MVFLIAQKSGGLCTVRAKLQPIFFNSGSLLDYDWWSGQSAEWQAW
jgi:hypothetical protein